MFKYLIVLSFLVFSCELYSQEMNACAYDSYLTENEIKQLCGSNDYLSNLEAEEFVDKILNQVGLSRNFIVKECPHLSNAVALNITNSLGGFERYILYDRIFLNRARGNTGTDWSAVSILAHEIGHHLNGHTLINLENHQKELQADEFSGFVLSKMGASLEESLSAIKQFGSEYSSVTHPNKYERVKSITIGWNKGTSQMVKEIRINTNETYESISPEAKNNMIKKFLESGNRFYKSKQYGLAATNFENIYRISPQDTAFLYNAAISADLGEEVDKAIGYYTELKDLGYTGIETEYTAVNKETGEEEVLPSKEEQKLYVQSGQYIKPSERKSDSKRPDIIKRIALLYVSQDKKDEAIAAVKEARAQNPKDIDLIITEANLYYNLKDVDRYRALIEEATKIDPNNADLYYNLGVVSADAKDRENAEKYYKRALEINPNYANAKMNLAALILSEETEIIDEMNGLGNSAADNKRYDELKDKRLDVYRKAIPYLEGVLEHDAENDAAIRTLMNMYSAIGEDAKAKAMKEKLEAIGG